MPLVWIVPAAVTLAPNGLLRPIAVKVGMPLSPENGVSSAAASATMPTSASAALNVENDARAADRIVVFMFNLRASPGSARLGKRLRLAVRGRILKSWV